MKGNLRTGFQEIEKLLSQDVKDVNSFTDTFLEALSKYQDKVREILPGKSSDEIKKMLDKNTDKNIKRAVDLILKHSKPEEKSIGFSLFKPGESQVGIGNEDQKLETRTLEKYNEFLRTFHELFFGDKNVKIEVFLEKLDKNKMRKIPYRIIHFYGNGVNKTFLISDQVGEASFVYDDIIDKNNFKNISKGEEINGITPAKIVYSKNYAKSLEKHLLGEFEQQEIKQEAQEKSDFETEKASFDEIYYKTIFSSITDKTGNKVEFDLKTIGMKSFSKLYFGRGTIFGEITGGTLLKYNGGRSLISLKMVLKLWGIERLDLPDGENNYNNPKHIQEILKIITDKAGKPITVDLKTIGVNEFKKLCFGKGTRFGQISGNSLLIKNGGQTLISLKKVLGLGGIERLDLPDEKINYNNPEHIKEILKIITDKDGKTITADLKTIGMKDFIELYFGRGIRFGQISGNILLSYNGGQTLISLKQVLKLGGIERPDLSDKINYNNLKHIQEILKIITDKAGETITADLQNIGMTEFSKLWFGRGTRFGQIAGNTLLQNHGGQSLISLKQVLSLWGIERPDLPDEEIDYNNPKHIQEILKVITDKDGKTITADLKTIGMREFSKLYFGRGTRFGQIAGNTLLQNHGGQSLISLKKVLGLGGIIEKPDLSDKINYNNPEHIKEVLGVITDKDGKIVKIDLQTIGVGKFLKLWFGRGTRFGQKSGSTLLKYNGGNTSISLKQVLGLGGIERDDLV